MTAPAISAPASKGRLGNGQLRRQVAEWLAARPGPHRVGEIAKDLGRSAGAVGNALTTLADRGEAGRLPGKPVRYEASSATAAAAAAIAPSPAKPAPPAMPQPAAPSAAPKAPAPPPARSARPVLSQASRAGKGHARTGSQHRDNRSTKRKGGERGKVAASNSESLNAAQSPPRKRRQIRGRKLSCQVRTGSRYISALCRAGRKTASGIVSGPLDFTARPEQLSSRKHRRR
jgi:hypothetical protein